MREERMAKSSYNFYSGWKSLILSYSCSIYGIWGESWLKTSEYLSYEGKEFKTAQKIPQQLLKLLKKSNIAQSV